jgi:hypothetical protein
MPRLARRDGFALPIVILVIAVLTMAVSASLASSAGETGITSAQRGQARAYNNAQTGLELFLTKRDSVCAARPAGYTCMSDPSAPTPGTDSVRMKFTRGYALVVSRQIRPGLHDTLPALFFVRSTGVDSTGRLSSRDTTSNVRSVGMVVQWSTATMNVLSAWTSLSGLTKNGTGIIDGNDQCGKDTAVAGVSVPKGQLTIAGSWSPTGSPPADTFSTVDTLKARVKIDWNAIINLNAIPADFTIPNDQFPPPGYFQSDTTHWPVIRIKTNGYTLPNQGRGIIIAEGDFSISGSDMWDGIVLVGGKLTSNGNNTTSGATLSGLNLLLPGAIQPPPSTVDDATANGQKTYLYNSCNVARAATRMRHYVAMSNTWIDDIPVW